MKTCEIRGRLLSAVQQYRVFVAPIHSGGSVSRGKVLFRVGGLTACAQAPHVQKGKTHHRGLSNAPVSLFLDWFGDTAVASHSSSSRLIYRVVRETAGK